jgi:glycosyltransferase involved in cell wall biosynthesis
MKNLWIVNHHATTGAGTTGGARHALLGSRLRAHGWQTVVLAASSEHYSGRQRVTGRRLRSDSSVDGVTFRWLRVPTYRGNGLGRIVNMLTFTVLVLAPGMTRGLPRPDVVIGSTVHPLAAWAALILARRHKVPFFFEIRDLWPETLIHMGAISRDGWISRLMRRLESHLCDGAVTVITTMPYARDYLVSRGVEHDKIVWVSNGVEIERFLEVKPRPASSNALEFMYFGALGTANALPILVEGFSEARRHGLDGSAKLRLVGEGPERLKLQQLVADLDLDEVVTVEDPVERARIPELASSADVLVLALLPLELYRYGISLNKLFEYMASGRPVLFAGRARGNPIDERGGVVTDAEAGAVARAMLDLARLSAAERDQLGAHNRTTALESFSYEALAGTLARELGGGAR